jgi:hypothetical protein
MRRRGTILILVAGLCGLIAALSFAFLMRMRSDAEETVVVEREIRSRIMLLAGCDYLLEAGRLGYDVDPHRDPAREHTEAFGWIDIRDAGTGPRDQRGAALFSAAPAVDGDGDGSPDRPAWPAIGAVARCPMYAMQRPPYAIQTAAGYNPIDTSDPSAPTWGVPLLLNPDPQPAVDNGWSRAAPGAVNDARYADFARGDTRPRAETVGLAWFRVYRESAAVFVITTGSGPSLGFRDWDEVRGAGEAAAFGGQRELFDEAVAGEARLHHRVEWGPETIEWSETGYQYHLQWDTPAHVRNPWVDSNTHLLTNMSLESPGGSTMNVGMKRAPNCLGSIRWVQRLDAPPVRW